MRIFILLSFFVFSLNAATFYTRLSGNWNAPNVWSASCGGGVAGGFPVAGDDVIICSGHTVDLTATHSIANFTINSGGTFNANGQTLSISGDWTNNLGGNFIAGTGTIQYNSISGNQTIYTPAGGETFYDLIINNTFGTVTANGNITITSGRTLTITSGIFDLGVNTLGQTGGANLTMTGGDLKLGKLGVTLPELTGTYNLTGGTISFNGTGAQTMRNLNAAPPAAYYSILIGGSGTKTLAGNIRVQSDWTNNGATLNGGGNTVTFTGTANTISGASLTDFPSVVFGGSANYTMDNSNSCSSLTFSVSGGGSSLTLGASNPSLTVSGGVTINQPTASVTTSLNVNGGTVSVSGTIAFVGGNITAGRVGQIAITSGSLIANGAVNFSSNTNDANQVITITGSGSVAFNSSVVTSSQTELRDGTLSITSNGTMSYINKLTMTGGTVSLNSSGTVNFNNADAFLFNSGSIPTFTTNFGSTINFNGHVTAGTALALANGSTAVFTGNGTITPTATITFGNVQINAGVTTTLAGNISLLNNWTNLGGTFSPGTNGVIFSGSGTQTITKAGGETFYNLTTNTTGPLTLANDVTVTNTLTMTVGDYDLNGKIFTLGNAAGSTLSRSAGIMYGGTFRRYWLAGTAVTSANYGLFPIGSSTDYRPVVINSTANPTSAGYVLARHYDAISVTNLGPYTDNEGDIIERKHDMYDAMDISGLAGGTYNIDVSFSGLSTVGVLTDMKLITYNGGVAGSVGTSAATTGTAASPTVKRTALGAANLQNDWVVGTKNKSATPLRPPYYSRKIGNWNDATVGNGTWSLTPGGAGPSCDCIPTSDALVYISSGQTVSVTAAASCDYVIIEDASTLNGTANFTANIDLLTYNSGNFAPTSGTWTIGRSATLGSSSVSSTANTTMTINGNLTIPSGASLLLNQNLNIAGNLVMDGILAVGTNTLVLNGSSTKNISGSGTITGSGTTSISTGNKSVLSGTNLTINTVFSITGAITVTNNGTINLTSNMTGSAGGSTWTNASGSVLNFSGINLLTTGTLNASAAPNTVNYNRNGDQGIKTPSGNYHNLFISVGGTKTFASGTSGFTIAVNNNVTIQDAAVFNVQINTLNGTGGLTMTGTAEFWSSNTGTFPSLTGTYNLTGGKISFKRGANGQIVRSLNSIPAAYYNIEFSHTSANTKTLAGPITVQNELTIVDNAKLDVTTSNYAINLMGNWTVTATNTDPFIERSGTVTLSGTVQQNISTVLAEGETFYNLVVNNSIPAQAVVLNSMVNVSNNLTLTDGHILTTAANLLTITNGSSTGIILNSTPQDSSFVKGPMGSVVAGNGLVSKVFPIGKDNDYRRLDLNIDHQPNATRTYTAELINSSAKALGYTVPGTMSWVSDMRYHTVTQSSSANLDGAQMWIYFNCQETNDFVQDLPNLRIAQWDGASAWVDRGASTNFGNLCDGTNYAGFVMSNTFTTFTGNKFALANDIAGANPLPVKLLSFDAELIKGKVDLNWTTASELNNEFFTIEKTKDGENFIEVARVEGAGNSNSIKEYNTIDKNPYSGISYYRLKQTDFDGKFIYSELVAINNPEGKEVVFTVFPNPSDGANINISLTGYTNNEEVLVVLHDIDGKMVFSKIFLTDDNGAFLTGVDPQKNLPPGIYLVVGSTRNDIYSRKLIIK